MGQDQTVWDTQQWTKEAQYASEVNGIEES